MFVSGRGAFLVLEVLDLRVVGNILARISFVILVVWVEVVGVCVVCILEVWMWVGRIGGVVFIREGWCE